MQHAIQEHSESQGIKEHIEGGLLQIKNNDDKSEAVSMAIEVLFCSIKSVLHYLILSVGK